MDKKVIIVDLDGTLALNQHRFHYIYPKDGSKPDWNGFFLACVDDEPNWPVIKAVRSFKESGYKVHIFSARGKIALTETIEWLDKHDVPHDQLTMKDIGCYTPDEELKREWLETLYPNYLEDILFILDDRDKVVNMWRSLGLVCFQVADGDF